MSIANRKQKKRELVTKFLGVFLDENVSWKNHINIVSTKVCKSIEVLYRSLHILNKFCLNNFKLNIFLL